MDGVLGVIIVAAIVVAGVGFAALVILGKGMSR